MVVVETHGDVEDETDEDRDESEGGLLFSKSKGAGHTTVKDLVKGRSGL